MSEGGSVTSGWKWKPVIRSPAHSPLLSCRLQRQFEWRMDIEKKPKMSCLWIYFMLTIIVITTGKSYRTIACTYIVSLGATDDNYWKTNVDDAMFSISSVGRLLEDGVGWRWRMSTIQIHMGLYFQHGCKICQILDATSSPGSIEFVFVDCAIIFVSVQGHGHITFQSMCNVWIDEMWNMVGIENLLFFIFLLTFLQRT